MSFWGIGIGAASSVAGGMMQGDAAGDAAQTAALGADEAAALFGEAEQANDKNLRGANQWGRAQYEPWDNLGRQGTNALASFMGMVPSYDVPAPKRVAPLRPERNDFASKAGHKKDLTKWRKQTGRPERATFPAGKKGDKQHKKAMTQWHAQRAAQEAEHQKAVAEHQRGAAAHEQQARESEGFGEYFEPYGVEEPTYKPYKDYEQFTDAHLKADPLFETELDENVRAWDQSAASKGSLMSGNSVAGLREITAGGIGRARDRHIQDYDEGRSNYLQDYGITHDEWQGGYDRDWDLDERKFNALTGLSTMGLGVQNARVGLNTDTAQNRVQNRQWSTSGEAQARMGAADARASGQLARGTSMGNAFNNMGQLGMLYGMGAFRNNNGTGRGNRGNPAVEEFYRNGGRPWGSV